MRSIMKSGRTYHSETFNRVGAISMVLLTLVVETNFSESSWTSTEIIRKISIFLGQKAIFVSKEYKRHGAIITPGRWQSKTLLTTDKHGSNIARNSVFDCHLSPVWRQRQSKILFLTIFKLRLSISLIF